MGNTKTLIIIMIVTQDLVCNSILNSSPGERNGKFGQNCMSGQKGKVHLCPNVSSSAHYRGCVVNGSGAMAATGVLLLLILHTKYVTIMNFVYTVSVFTHIIIMHD